ncbi:hypothetical protein CK203_068175 [Vitis vinifera]|uniref:Uncharacterized protein n=1 Tax=Vitis vinifera TaxID=29760 RepID=A0A438E1S1_VITVI|nr:hypothetical protein CK203_068175 [Vitis vinifera]
MFDFVCEDGCKGAGERRLKNLCTESVQPRSGRSCRRLEPVMVANLTSPLAVFISAIFIRSNDWKKIGGGGVLYSNLLIQ